MAVVALTLYEPTAEPNVFKPHRTRGRVETGAAGDLEFGSVEQPTAGYVLVLNGWRRIERGWYALWSGVVLQVTGVVPSANERVTTVYADETDDAVLVEEPLTVGGEPLTIGGEPLTVRRKAGATNG